MFCGECTAVHYLANGRKVHKLLCRSWGCPECAPRRHRQLKRQAREGKPNTFLTLTCKPIDGETPAQAARRMVIGWRQVKRLICKRYGYKKLPALAVFEATKAGWPHMHVLLRCAWIDQRWLSEAWEKLTGAKIVDIRRVDHAGRVAAYVAKYIAKDTAAFEGCKRYWSTIGWRVEEEPRQQPLFPSDRCERWTNHIGQVIRHWQSRGFVHRVDDGDCVYLLEHPP